MLNFGRHNSLPMVIQAEAGECGLACLTMIASYFGESTSLVALRQKFYLSNKGASLRSIIEIANQLSISSRAIRLDIEALSRLELPAILHWDFDHFVVLKKIKRNGVIIHDPAVGIRYYSFDELRQHFTGVALELTPLRKFNRGNTSEGLKITSFWNGAKGLKRSLIHIVFLSILIQIFALASPLYLQIVVDDVLVKNDEDLLFILTLGFLSIAVISVITKATRGFASLYLTNQLGYGIGDSIMHHLIRLPLSYFEKRHMGDVVSRFNSAQAIQKFITDSSVAVLIDGLLSITTLTLMLIYSPFLSLVVVISVLIYAAFRFIQFQSVRVAKLESISSMAKLDSVFMESIRSLQSIKLANKEMERQGIWKNQFAESINADAKVGRLTIFYDSANSMITGIEYVLIIYLGSTLVLDGVFSIGMLYAFVVYRSHFSGAMVSLVNQWIEYMMLSLHLERLADITQTYQEDGLNSNPRFALPVEGSISLSNASFSYSRIDPEILSNCNIDIEPGDFVAISGASGIGKTTLLKLLMGLITPTFGCLKIDGQEVASIGLRSLRANISAVLQNDALFSGSLRENIAFLDFSPDQKRVVECAQLACIHDEIENSPLGYDSQIGDMGSALSEGQQQRILLARALYSMPRIVFLDEGTAHVDSATEDKIFRNLRNLKVTCIYITHSDSLLRFANKIVTIGNDGQTTCTLNA